VQRAHKSWKIAGTKSLLFYSPASGQREFVPNAENKMLSSLGANISIAFRVMKRRVFSMAAGGAQSAFILTHTGSDLITFILCPEPKSKQKKPKACARTLNPSRKTPMPFQV
jgi:hypothetical protein